MRSSSTSVRPASAFPTCCCCAASTSCGSSRRSSPAWRSPGWCVRRPMSRNSNRVNGLRRLSMLGGWAEQVVVPPANLTPTPDDIDDAEAVALLGNYQTMYFALAKRGALRPGETVLVLGSAGGVGTAAVQIAKALGAKVIAMVHRPQAMEFVKSLGPDVVLPLTRRLAAGGQGAHRRPRRRPGGRPHRRRGVRRRGPRARHRGPVAGDRLCGRRHSDRQGQPAAAAQRQRRRRRLRRVRQPQARIAVGVRVRGRRVGQGGTAATAADPVSAVGGQRRAAEPGRRRRARQRSYWSRDESPRRWRSTCSAPSSTGAPASSASCEAFGRSHGLHQDWSAMADDWRAGYPPAMDRVRRGELPWTRIDDLHRMILVDLLAGAGITSSRRRGHRPPQPRVAPPRPVAGQRARA